MFFWNKKSEEEKAADRLLGASQAELQKLREEIEERNEHLNIQIVSNQRKIQKLLAKGQQASEAKQRIIAQKCTQLERRVKKARRELKENLNQLGTVGVAELLVEGRKSSEFTETFKEIIGAENPSQFKAALTEIQTQEDLDREERDRLNEIGNLYDMQYSAAEESDPDKFLAKMQGAGGDDAEIDVFADPEPVPEDEFMEDIDEKEEDRYDPELA